MLKIGILFNEWVCIFVTEALGIKAGVQPGENGCRTHKTDDVLAPIDVAQMLFRTNGRAKPLQVLAQKRTLPAQAGQLERTKYPPGQSKQKSPPEQIPRQ